MRLTLYTDYSIRILIYLGQNPGRRVAIQEIANIHGISQTHLVKVVNRLSSNGIVLARRGRSGGLELAGGAHKILIGDVVRLMEADLPAAIVPCIPGKGQPCILADICRLRGVVTRSIDAFMAVLDGVTLHDMLTDRKKSLIP
ncbi:Rrf2 family transcriptional regulator [Komagataeibacter intermedius]|uniref:Rrf2 family transcriptional regulator n=2 Tax=Komagataeibacter intermedius TaxID=66229 RepID=A0A0N1FAJ1_9PROT|nr:Rrf2 family transcriptional regulator [Komagataeibacter intermedius]KPH86157.1 Rrf2 family transcriptional regulator [Komagataeibacter intermedius AF2]MCF3637053.1 Rrf2 family transcriptional regulator [Komagataeibacter intermedius]GAN88666.1 transcriptional regulator BadM/Rrf82 [Komagataeibacter intermedius TF2]GBQ67354.1 Rrf2 family transcriptional regulator [Komagataeibacter intermedius NRIC 0521]